MLYSLEAGHRVGNCFGFGRLGLFLTAAHVIADLPKDEIRVLSVGPEVALWPISEIRLQQSADVAALYVPDGGQDLRFECFEHGKPPSGYADHTLGEEVVSVGYPLLANEEPVTRRLMRGHLQAS